MPSFADQAASRRKFLQFLAGSPLLAAGGLEAFAGEGPVPGSKLPDPLMWAPMRTTELIKTPKEAINVFDFEPVCRTNVPPAHFGYMASGIDDEVTLRANREGFLKFQLRPRRLVDVSKVDMSVEILGVKYPSPIVLAPVGGQRSFHDEGEVAVRPRRQGRESSANSLDRDQPRGRGRQRRARPADLVPALCHQQMGGGGDHGEARGEGRLLRGGGHHRPQRRPQPGDPVPHAALRYPRLQWLPRPLQPAGEHEDPCHVSGHRPLGADQHPVLRHDLGLLQAPARHHQDEDRAQGHPRLGGRRARRRQRHRRASSCPITAPAARTPDARPSTRCRKSSRR